MPTLKFTRDSNASGNTGDTTTDAVAADTMDPGFIDPTSQASVSYHVLLQVDNIAFTYRTLSKLGVKVHRPRRCSHDTSLNLPCTIYLGSETPPDTCRGHPYVEVCGFTGGYL